MNNLDDMIIAWREMDGKLSALVEENRRLAEEVKKNRLRTSQEKLIQKYRVFIILEAVCIPLMFLIIVANPMVVEKFKWITFIYFACFFLLEIGFDGFLLYRLTGIDIYKDSISHISRTARSNWKIHKIGVMIGLPVAIGAVILFCLAVGGSEETLYGVFVGLIIGLGIGLNEFFKFMKSYKAMSTEDD